MSSDPLSTQITNQLLSMMEKENVTKADLAEGFGISRPAITQWFKPRAGDITLSTIIRVARFLGYETQISFKKRR